MLFVLIGMLVVCTIINPVFFSQKNLFNLFQQNAVYGMMAIGMTFLIISGAIDLSAGSVVALTGVLAAHTMALTGNFFVGIMVGLLVGAGVGALNGLLVTRLKINYFITTLGTQIIVKGIVLLITNGTPVTNVPQGFSALGMGKLGVVPVSVIVWAVIVVAMQFVLKKTRYGQYVYAMGGNQQASWLSGINVNKYTLLTFLLTSLFAAAGHNTFEPHNDSAAGCGFRI
jgi:ribose/xylose/arabinose/galactoside ABC-type transport system permease subunit